MKHPTKTISEGDAPICEIKSRSHKKGKIKPQEGVFRAKEYAGAKICKERKNMQGKENMQKQNNMQGQKNMQQTKTESELLCALFISHEELN